ncbi:(Fe-S)-binding protein [Clostridium sp.]|uniref:(Fe-S)-binding protein n=1 Tax=Clostridium sp. TaxID=1506 RepID=UPI0032173A98
MIKGKISIKTHQLLSFNPVFSKLEAGDNVFWPGCAILSMGEDIVIKTYKLLKMQIPDLVLSSMCCGKPSLHIQGGKPYEKKNTYLKEAFLNCGIKKIYTLCPNCQHTLSKYSGCEVISAWTILDEAIPKDKYDICKGRSLSLHDPCPVRDHLENTVATRNILKKLGVDILEFTNHGEKTMCCGKKDMIMTLNPEKGQKIFMARAKQATSREVVTYCASCVDTFRNNDFQASHILELLWQTQTTGSWINRYKAVKGIKRRDK